MTVNAAYAHGHDDQTGSIEIGKQADFVVLDQSLLEIPVSRIDKPRCFSQSSTATRHTAPQASTETRNQRTDHRIRGRSHKSQRAKHRHQRVRVVDRATASTTPRYCSSRPTFDCAGDADVDGVGFARQKPQLTVTLAIPITPEGPRRTPTS